MQADGDGNGNGGVADDVVGSRGNRSDDGEDCTDECRPTQVECSSLGPAMSTVEAPCYYNRSASVAGEGAEEVAGSRSSVGMENTVASNKQADNDVDQAEEMHDVNTVTGDASETCHELPVVEEVTKSVSRLSQVPERDRKGKLVHVDGSDVIGEVVTVGKNGFIKVKDPWGIRHQARAKKVKVFDVYSDMYEIYMGMLSIASSEQGDMEVEVECKTHAPSETTAVEAAPSISRSKEVLGAAETHTAAPCVTSVLTNSEPITDHGHSDSRHDCTGMKTSSSGPADNTAQRERSETKPPAAFSSRYAGAASYVKHSHTDTHHPRTEQSALKGTASRSGGARRSAILVQHPGPSACTDRKGTERHKTPSVPSGLIPLRSAPLLSESSTSSKQKNATKSSRFSLLAPDKEVAPPEQSRPSGLIPKRSPHEVRRNISTFGRNIHHIQNDAVKSDAMRRHDPLRMVPSGGRIDRWPGEQRSVPGPDANKHTTQQTQPKEDTNQGSAGDVNIYDEIDMMVDDILS